MPTSVSWTGPAPISPLHGSQLRVPRLRSRSTDMPTSLLEPKLGEQSREPRRFQPARRAEAAHAQARRRKD